MLPSRYQEINLDMNSRQFYSQYTSTNKLQQMDRGRVQVTLQQRLHEAYSLNDVWLQ